MLTAPLGIIGVTFVLSVFDKPFGFVDMLGTIALSGMIMRNPVILVGQISQNRATGIAPWQAVATLLTVLFLPAHYAAWFRAKMPEKLSV